MMMIIRFELNVNLMNLIVIEINVLGVLDLDGKLDSGAIADDDDDYRESCGQ